MKRVIINADDFGLSRSINRGIIESFRKGILTSASLLVNMPGFEDALNLMKENRLLSVGIHINVIRGRPVSSVEKIRTLCKGDFFRGNIFTMLGCSYAHRRRLDEFARECRAQIEKAMHYGITITHLDSEKHVHMIKPFFKIFLSIAREYGISRVRNINEIPYLNHKIIGFPWLYNKQLYAVLYLSLCSKKNRPLLRAHNFDSPDYFYGVLATGNMTTEKYVWILSHLKEGTTEIMCHPGYIDNEWQNYPLFRERYHINTKRQKELDALLNSKVRELINTLNISLISYGEL